MTNQSLIARCLMNSGSGFNSRAYSLKYACENRPLYRGSKNSSSAEIVSGTPAEQAGDTLYTVAVCVCTCRRPQMLRRCLAAISKLTRPEGADISLIVVDNEAEPNNRAIVEEFGGVYVHEPRRGIVHARNAAVEAALTLDPDFIAFTDDDCEPAENWLAALLEAQRNTGADAVRGRTAFSYPDPLPWWVLPQKKKSRATGMARPVRPLHVSTNNVLFSSRLIREDGLGLRFDPRFNTIGGEDSEFFIRAQERGALIVSSDLPVVVESVPAERCTYWRQVRRDMQYGTGDTMVQMDRGRALSVIMMALRRMLEGLLCFLAAGTLGVYSLRRFKKYALRGGKKLMYAAGQISVLAGYRYQGYRAIDGG